MRNGYIENIKKIIQLQDTDKFIFVVGMDLSGDINTVSDVGTACALREYLDDEYSCDNTKKVSDEINHQLTLPSGKREYNYGDCKLVNLNLKKNGNCSEPPRFITIAE